MMDPVIAMLHNMATNRWHPILYLFNPLPGNPENLHRHKSKGHHTVGFDTRAEAVGFATDTMVGHARNFGEPAFCLDVDMPWDGEGTPASVAFFSDVDADRKCQRIM